MDFLTRKSVSICLLPGGESVLRSGVPGAALVQGFGTGAPHLSHGRLHVGRPVGRDHDMRVGRDALVPRPRPPQRHPLAHTSLSISAARAQPGARRALSQTVQAVQGEQETLPGTGQGGEDIEAGLWSNVRDGRRHTCRRTAVDTVARQVSIQRRHATRSTGQRKIDPPRRSFLPFPSYLAPFETKLKLVLIATNIGEYLYVEIFDNYNFCYVMFRWSAIEGRNDRCGYLEKFLLYPLNWGGKLVGWLVGWRFRSVALSNVRVAWSAG